MVDSVAISYAWIDDAYKERVIGFVNYLRENGYDAVMDELLKQRETAIDFNEMMAKMIPNAQKVIVFLSPKYKERADSFVGGVGLEYRILLNEINRVPDKYIFVTFEKLSDIQPNDLLPNGLGSREIIEIDISSREWEESLFAKLSGTPIYRFEEVKGIKRIPEARVVRAIIPNKFNTNIFHGDAKTVQIQQDTHNSSPKASEVINEAKDTIIEKEKTSLKDILKDKFKEAVVGSVLFIIAAILYKVLLSGLFDAIESNVKIFLIVIMIAFFFLGLGLLIICVYDILNILPLFNEGSFVELESKSEWLDKLGEFFRNSEYTMPKDVRATGKCYKNVDGEIYKIKGKICPYCETQPIGKMVLNYSNYSKIYFWKCSQNQAHMVEFDYKKKI